MQSRRFFSSVAARVCVALLLAVPAAIYSQPHIPTFTPIPAMTFDDTGPGIRAHAEPLKPFTVAGERGVLVGQQDGTFEAWLLPVKVLSHLTIEAEVEGYTVPIDVNQQAAQIEVRPDRTVVTYAHLGFTVRQIMFSPADAAAGTGAVVLFEFDCLHPTDFTLRFTPELRWMWPERNEGVPGVEWVAPAPDAFEKTGGFYVLHSDYPDFAAAVTMPGARPGILAPYQERPAVHPVELKLHIDPAHDHGRLYPLLMAVATDRAAADSGRLGEKLASLNAGIATAYQRHAAAYKKMLAETVSIETPDKALNEAFKWAVISIEQLKTKALPTNETALVAGYYASGDSARPGFGWFFGRDALYTLYAVNGYGDFALAKSELEFLIRRQRADGKIMHEYSQTAASIDWQSFPYMYAAADATPLFLLAMLDYVRASGDVAFLSEHRDAVEKAWAFETAHAPGPDQGGNGIYENTQGTGWVESWPGGMPHQEIYLALLDQQASAAMSEIEKLLKDAAKTDSARQRADAVKKTIEAQFYDQEKGCYAFSRNADGSLDRTSTVYPALAWWSAKTVTSSSAYLTHPDDCLKQLAAHTLNTDWGLRDVSNVEKIYDGMSYHQGSVWPLFTGWAALAEYRGGQPLAGYQMLMENANLTWAQDLGADTELLSGDFFIPFGRSTSHQLWSSAMVITPTLRGLFGIDIDAQTKTITVNPHLPAEWKDAAIRNIRDSDGSSFDITFSHDATMLRISRTQHNWRLRSDLPGAKSDNAGSGDLLVPLPVVQVGDAPHQSAIPGDRTNRFRILSEEWAPNQIVLNVEGLAGSSAELPVLKNKLVKLNTEVSNGLSNDADSAKPGVSLSAIDKASREANAPSSLRFHFPPGDGWKTMTVKLTW